MQVKAEAGCSKLLMLDVEKGKSDVSDSTMICCAKRASRGMTCSTVSQTSVTHHAHDACGINAVLPVVSYVSGEGGVRSL